MRYTRLTETKKYAITAVMMRRRAYAGQDKILLNPEALRAPSPIILKEDLAGPLKCTSDTHSNEE